MHTSFTFERKKRREPVGESPDCDMVSFPQFVLCARQDWQRESIVCRNIGISCCSR